MKPLPTSSQLCLLSPSCFGDLCVTCSRPCAWANIPSMLALSSLVNCRDLCQRTFSTVDKLPTDLSVNVPRFDVRSFQLLSYMKASWKKLGSCHSLGVALFAFTLSPYICQTREIKSEIRLRMLSVQVSETYFNHYVYKL